MRSPSTGLAASTKCADEATGAGAAPQRGAALPWQRHQKCRGAIGIGGERFREKQGAAGQQQMGNTLYKHTQTHAQSVCFEIFAVKGCSLAACA
jgi:hypothetical protein